MCGASLRFSLGRHPETTLSIGFYIGCISVEITTEPFFLTQFSKRSPKSEHYVLIGHFLTGGPILYQVFVAVPVLQVLSFFILTTTK